MRDRLATHGGGKGEGSLDGPGPQPSEEEVMREVVEEIEAARHEDAARRSR